jgi:putative ABC transport system permease protein
MIFYLMKALAVRLRSGRALFLLTVFGVALGVASVLSIQIINRNALAAFRGGMQAVSGEADFTVVGRGPSLAESIYPEVLAQPGVDAAWPIDRVGVALADERDVVLDIVGVDLFAPTRLPWKVEPADLGTALGTPGWIALSPAVAAEIGLDTGDSFEVTSGARRVGLTVGALVDFQSIAPLASRRLAVMDIARMQDLFGSRGSIRQIDVRAAEGVDVARLLADLQQRLGNEVAIVTPEQRERQAAGLLGAFRLNLTALSLISLFVGGFLVYSSTQASLVRRRNEFGLLRSLGASRGQIVTIVLGEVLLMGSLGVALGLPLGWLVARSNVDTVSATLSNLYLLEAIETLELPLWLYLLAGGIGIGGALVGALIPSLEMSRREPRDLLAPFTLHERIHNLALPLALAGAVVLRCGRIALPAVRLRRRHRGPHRCSAVHTSASEAALRPRPAGWVRSRLRHPQPRSAAADHVVRRRRPGGGGQHVDRHHPHDRQLSPHGVDLDRQHGAGRHLHHQRIVAARAQRGNAGRRSGGGVGGPPRRAGDRSAAPADHDGGGAAHPGGRRRCRSAAAGAPLRHGRRRCGGGRQAVAQGRRCLDW